MKIEQVPDLHSLEDIIKISNNETLRADKAEELVIELESKIIALEKTTDELMSDKGELEAKVEELKEMNHIYLNTLKSYEKELNTPQTKVEVLKPKPITVEQVSLNFNGDIEFKLDACIKTHNLKLTFQGGKLIKAGVGE